MPGKMHAFLLFKFVHQRERISPKVDEPLKNFI